MRLSEYLTEKGMTVAEGARSFAEFLHAKLGRPVEIEHETFRRWAANERVPRPHTMAELIEWTEGKVTAADLCGLPASS